MTSHHNSPQAGSPSLARRFVRAGFVLLLLYVVYCVLMFFFQSSLIFPASMAGQPSDTLSTMDTQVIRLPTEEGATVAWLIPTQRANSETPAPLVVFFHGNAELIDHQHGIIDLYSDLGMHVLLVEYRGYGHSDGTPSQQHIVADTLAVIEQVMQRDDIELLVLHGRSIGGGLATQVALETDPAALIVESTFTSVSGMAKRFGVPPFIVQSPLKSEQAFEQLAVPTLIMHGRNDSIVPVSHATKLKQAASDATLVLFDSDHNDLPSGRDINTYRNEIEKLLKRTGVLSK